MSLKKPRIHITGISNIDYKSKNEIEKIFNNFNNYKKQPDKNNEPLDPDQIVHYKSPRPKKPNMYNVSLKEAQEQSGDSLLYADTYNLRRELRLKRLEENVSKKIKLNALSKVYNSSQKIDLNFQKTEQNKQNKETDEKRLKKLRKKVQEKLIPHKNIQNIFISWQKNYLKNNELSVYELHKRINDLGIPISYNEAIGLISLANKRNSNSLNLDEFKNLFFDDSNDINDTKNISSIKIPTNTDIKKIENDYQKEQNNKYKKYINNKIFENHNFNILESMLHIKNSNFVNSMNELNNKDNNKNGLCDFQTFKNVLDTLRIPEKYKNIYIAKSIFNEFKEENKELMNYSNFIERCKNIKIPNDFFQFQNKYVNLLSNKFLDNEKKREKYMDILLENDRKNKEYIKNLGACKSMDKIINNNICLTEINQLPDINNNNNNPKKLTNNISIDNSNLNNNKYSTLNTETEINNININRKNHTINYELTNINNKNNYNYCDKESYSHYQPSLNFLNLLFKDRKKYYDRYKEGVKEFSPNNVISLKKEKESLGKKSINSRFFNKSKYKFPPIYMSYDSTMPGYLNEKERFNRNNMHTVEKKYDLDMREKMNKKRNEINERWNKIIKFQQDVLDVKESLGQIKRTKNLHEYENRMIMRNQIDE